MTEIAVSGRARRFLDATTKLTGVLLLAVAFEVGIVSTAGVSLALAGTLLGVCTVFVTEDIQ
ncbi:MAG: hypothetical protein ABEJ58_08850 [Halodesulfurarchaeum sp.]